jgi:hypothetical protein
VRHRTRGVFFFPCCSTCYSWGPFVVAFGSCALYNLYGKSTILVRERDQNELCRSLISELYSVLVLFITVKPYPYIWELCGLFNRIFSSVVGRVCMRTRCVNILAHSRCLFVDLRRGALWMPANPNKPKSPKTQAGKKREKKCLPFWHKKSPGRRWRLDRNKILSSWTLIPGIFRTAYNFYTLMKRHSKLGVIKEEDTI